MRKNIFNTVAGLLVAVSMLFAAIGCTNINDPDTLKNDSFTVNKMAITGFKVTGLDGSYDHATVQLKSGDTVIAEGFIADDADDLKPGSAFVKLATPYIFDAGENSPKDFECYLEVVKSGVSLAKVEAVDAEDATKTAPAKLAVISSPYGTKDADLAKRYVEVEVNNGVGAFSFAEDLAASKRFSYTELPLVDWNTLSNASWATVEGKTREDAEYAKYKITINNLKNDANGMRYVVAGEIIGSTKEVAGGHWNELASNNADEGLISEVEDGSITFEFYGKAPTGWDNGTNVAIKIAAIDNPVKCDPWLCLLAGPKGGDGKPTNVNLPTDKDYTITIDAEKANATTNYSLLNERFVKVLSFTLKAEKIQASKGAGYVAFCANWLPKNVYGATTTNKVTFDKITDGTATLALGGVELWAGKPDTFIDVEMQVLNPQTDKDFWADDAKVMSSFKVHFDDKWIGTGVHITYDLDKDEVTIENTKVNVVGYEIKNLDDNGVKYYIMSQSPANSGNAQPGNAWSTATTIFGTVADKTFVVDCAAWEVTDEVDVQVKKEGASGIDWNSGVQISTENLDSMPNGSDCIIVVDCEAKTAEFAPKQ